MSRTLVIAEIGSCHDGDIVKAFELINEAKRAGADVAKAQYWSSAERLAERRRAASYVDIYRRYQVPESWLPKMKAQCDAFGIEFMCTTYLPEDVAVVAPFVKRFKIASFEAQDREHLKAHVPFGKDVIVSEGMLDENTPQLRLQVPGARVFYLHCVSAYPAPIEELNLSTLKWRPNHSGFDGFSDHSGKITTGGIAVAAGAEIIEVHTKLDDTDPNNPDAGDFALTPDVLAPYVIFIREVERMLGDGLKRVTPSEAAMAQYRVTP